MALSVPIFQNLTLAEVPAVILATVNDVQTWQVNPALTPGAYVAGVDDPATTERVFNPIAEGNPVGSGDDYTKWMPVIAAVSAAMIDDAYWSPASDTSLVNVGQVTLQLKAAAANTVEASSPMTFKVSQGALITLVTAGTF